MRTSLWIPHFYTIYKKLRVEIRRKDRETRLVNVSNEYKTVSNDIIYKIASWHVLKTKSKQVLSLEINKLIER